jgi:hypothetical protein
MFLFITKVESSGSPKYLTSIFSIRPIASRCRFFSKSNSSFRFLIISLYDKHPVEERCVLEKIAHFILPGSQLILSHVFVNLQEIFHLKIIFCFLKKLVREMTLWIMDRKRYF